MSDDEQTPEDIDEQTASTSSEDVTSEPSDQAERSADASSTGNEPVTPATRPVRPAASAASRARRIGGSAVRATPVAGSAEAPTGRRSSSDGSARAAAPATGAASGKAARTPVSTENKSSGSGTSVTKADGDGKRSRFGRTRSGDSPKSDRSAGKTTSKGGGRRPGSRAALRWLPAGVLTAAAVAMAVVLIVVISAGRWDRPASSTVRDKVLSAAKTCLVATNTYKYTALDAFEKKGLACSASASAAEFKQSVEKILKKFAPTVKQSQTFQVNSAGIMNVTDDNQWDVLVYGQLSVVNVSTKGRVDPYGAQLRMQKIKGQWRMVRLDTLCSTSLITSGNKCT